LASITAGSLLDENGFKIAGAMMGVASALTMRSLPARNAGGLAGG
jgi:hypothetical protein